MNNHILRYIRLHGGLTEMSRSTPDRHNINTVVLWLVKFGIPNNIMSHG